MSVISFKPGEDIIEYLEARNRQAAEAAQKVPPAIRDIQDGQYAVSVRPDYGFIIFIAVEGNNVELGDDADEEAIEEAEISRDSRERGFVFGRHYSVACIDGELGSTHVTRMNAVIPKEVFEQCKALKWGPEVREVLMPWMKTADPSQMT